MRTGHVTLRTLVVAALLSPAAAAQWSAYGSSEPDTAYDRDDALMWPAATGEPGRVYFNVVSGSGYPPAMAFGKPLVNPNVGALGTHNEPPGSEYHVAMLGVWVDCNGDGYVGMAEGALREYRDALLLDDSTCPRVDGPPDAWTEGAHNYNGLVTELVPIARTTSDTDPRMYRDADARVWGDFHRPDERPTHRSCALNPQPRGTWQSTGGAMNYVDCRYDVLGAWNAAMDGVNDPFSLRFSDPEDARTGPLGQIATLGTEDADHSAVRLVDCEAPQMFHSGDFFNGTPLGPSFPAAYQNITVPTFAPEPGNTQDPTVPGTVNQTNEELNGDCDTTNDFGHDTYDLLEDDFNGVDPNNKIEADWNFNFATSARQELPAELPSGLAGIHQDAGVGIGGSRWVSDSTWLSKTGPRLVRVDLATGAVSLPSAYWLSFYARVGPATLAKGLATPGGSGVYGAWHCAGADSGIHQGWNCDPDLWYANPDGSFIADPNGLFARPGFGYQLRDVDCHDGEVEAIGLGMMPAYYGPDPCPP